MDTRKDFVESVLDEIEGHIEINIDLDKMYNDVKSILENYIDSVESEVNNALSKIENIDTIEEAKSILGDLSGKLY